MESQFQLRSEWQTILSDWSSNLKSHKKFKFTHLPRSIGIRSNTKATAVPVSAKLRAHLLPDLTLHAALNMHYSAILVAILAASVTASPIAFAHGVGAVAHGADAIAKRNPILPVDPDDQGPQSKRSPILPVDPDDQGPQSKRSPILPVDPDDQGPQSKRSPILPVDPDDQGPQSKRSPILPVDPDDQGPQSKRSSVGM